MLAACSRPARRSFFRFRPTFEPLEGRLLMAGLDVPQLSSRPGAAATIYLDFDGHVESSWGSFSNVTTPAYDRDGDPSSFSASELTSINEVWIRVSEDFAPFNVNVTTVAPPTFDHRKTLTVVIGGSWSDWYGTQANGVSFTGGFTSYDPNVAYVFAKNIGGGLPRWVADQVSHEAGHTFGLRHQSTWSGNTLQAELSTGSGGVAPIMGSGLFASRTVWFNGTTNQSPTTFQDDMAIIAGATNGFGFVADDYADTLATAGQMPINGSSVSLTGLIGQSGDQDVFKFTTVGGNLSFNLAVSSFGANLDSVLELRDANGQVVKIANDATSGVFSSVLTANVASGTYYLIVRSSGGYGNVGQYTLTGTVVPAVVTAPEISLLLNGTDLPSGGSASFGSTLVGTPVTQTFTVQNLGNGDLTLSSLVGAAFPAGFSLVSDLSAMTLTPGQSTAFSVQLDATAAGTFGGAIHVRSNDADEGAFDIVLGGTVTQPIVLAPEIRIWGNETELTSGNTFSFGSTLLGTPVTKTFTVQNVGNGDLVLSPVDPSMLPAGFSLVQALGATTLHPTDFTTFVVQLNATAFGAFGGTLHLLSNDADEGSFDINLSGAATAPEIRVFAGSTELASGDGFSFGSTPVGTPVTLTFTIQNAGDGGLVVTGFDGSSLPAGYSLVAGFGTTTVAPGASIILSVRLDATAAGAFGGTIHVLSSDADEGSFDIALSGVATAPEIAVFVGSAELQSGDALDFGTTLIGAPITQTITIQNVGNGGLLLTQVDESSLPLGFTLLSNVSGVTLAPGATTTFTVQFNAAVVGTFGGTIQILSSDADEGSFSVVFAGSVTTPEIRVFVGSTEFTSGGTIDFGTTLMGTPVTRTVTVTNVGNANLILSLVDPSELPAGFSLVSNLGATTLAPGQSTTFALRLDAAASGSPSGLIHLVNSDTDDGSFALVLQGVVNNPPPLPPVAYVKTIDNGADGFAATGTWHVQNSKGGFDQDIQFANKTEKNDKTVATATWKFTGLAAGQYRVSVTAPGSPSFASDAPFSVFDGATLLRTVLVNQSKGTGDSTADGFQWQNLGTFSLQGATLVVQLTNRANGHVVADAVRIERVTTPIDSPPPSPNLPHPKDDKQHGKDGGPTPNHGGHKSSPQHHPASDSQQPHKGKNSPKPAPSHDDPPYLDGLAADVARHHGLKSSK